MTKKQQHDLIAQCKKHILDGKIFDSSSGCDLFAVYDSGNDWTTLGAIPEPGTVAMIVLGALSIAGAVRFRLR